MRTIMITAPSSGQGKTLISMGLIRGLRNRKLDVSAFKTGPDFVDTKYLSMASGRRAGNLDIHMMGEGIRESLSMNKGDYGIIEGAMGYFDGIYNTFENSSYHISNTLSVNAILVYAPKGEMFSAIPKIKGMAEFKDSRIKGIILNKIEKSMYTLLREQIERYTGIKVLGYIERDRELEILSKHLNDKQVKHSENTNYIINRIASAIEKTVDLDRLIPIMNDIEVSEIKYPDRRQISIAIAYDEAFSFYYNENLKLLENICQVEYFSPLKDKQIPKCDLLLLGGGDVELYKEELSQNLSMIDSIRNKARLNGYIYGEGGGFTYLLDSIEAYPMCGIFKGSAIITNSLDRFGYVNIELNKDSILGGKGDILKGQEFHKTTAEIEGNTIFSITKPKSRKSWQCGYGYKNVLGAYPHINFLGNKKALYNLLDIVEKSSREDKNVYKKSY